MVVTASETERTTAIGAFINPRHMLWQSLRDLFANRRVTAVWTVGPIHRRLGRHGAEQRSDPLHVRLKSHVEVPLIVGNKRLHTARGRMGWQACVVCIPVWIDRPIRFKVAAKPLQKLWATLILRYFHRIMQAGKTRASRQMLSKNIQMRQGWVTAATICVHHNRIRAVEHLLILWPSARVNFTFDIRRRLLNGIRKDA